MGHIPSHWLCAAVALAPFFATAVASAQPVRYEGIVRPSRVVTLKAPLDERVDELAVKQADEVAAGQPIARMASDVQEAILVLATHFAEDTTAVEIAELGLEDAELRYRRLKQAFDADAANELELLAAQVAMDRAEVELRAAERSREEAGLRLALESQRLARHVVEAPFSGVVSEVMSEAGASLTRDDPILELIALDPLEASFDLPDSTYGQLAVGDEVTVTAGSPVDRELNGVVDRVVPRIDPGSRTYRLIVRIENPDQSLPSGFVAELLTADDPSTAAAAPDDQGSGVNPRR